MRQWRDRENGERDFLSLHFRIFSQFSHSLAIFSLFLSISYFLSIFSFSILLPFSLTLSISSFSLHFLFIFSFSLHFLAARLQGCNNFCSPDRHKDRNKERNTEIKKYRRTNMLVMETFVTYVVLHSKNQKPYFNIGTNLVLAWLIWQYRIFLIFNFFKVFAQNYLRRRPSESKLGETLRPGVNYYYQIIIIIIIIISNSSSIIIIIIIVKLLLLLSFFS